MTRCGRRAFSLIETLLVIGIVGVLLGLLLPGVQSSRDSARRVACSSHLRQLGMAAQNYESVHGHLPPGPYFDRRSPDSLLSWFAKLLPYFDQDGLYRESLQACRTEPNATLSPPHRGMTTSIPILTCPADGRLGEPQISSNGVRAAFTDYVGLSVVAPSDRGRIGLPCAFHDVPGLRTSDVRDGSSTTILLAERPPPANFSAGWWYPNLRFQDYVGPNIAMTIGSDFGYFNPTDCASGDWTFSPGRLDNPCDRNHLWSLHRGGANFCFMDGSVRFLSYSARELVVALATINGGEVVELP